MEQSRKHIGNFTNHAGNFAHTRLVLHVDFNHYVSIAASVVAHAIQQEFIREIRRDLEQIIQITIRHVGHGYPRIPLLKNDPAIALGIHTANYFTILHTCTNPPTAPRQRSKPVRRFTGCNCVLANHGIRTHVFRGPKSVFGGQDFTDGLLKLYDCLL